MSKLLIIPFYLKNHPRLFWGFVVFLIFSWLVVASGFTILPDELQSPTQIPWVTQVPGPTATPIPSALTATAQPPDNEQTETTVAIPTPTPLPDEYLANPDQTTGIILGASVLVLVILIGTLSVLRSQQKKR